MLVALHCGMYLLLHWSETYVTILGFLALGLEATVSLSAQGDEARLALKRVRADLLSPQLPIPQLLVNFERKSTAGFRHSVLAGWVGGVSPAADCRACYALSSAPRSLR